jgi:hypothetical protein
VYFLPLIDPCAQLLMVAQRAKEMIGGAMSMRKAQLDHDHRIAPLANQDGGAAGSA